MSDADADLVRAARRGDRDAFGVVVQRYQGRLFGLVLMMVRERAGAEEVTQDAFVRAYMHLDRYDESRPLYPWLASIAVRLAQNWLRAHGRTVRHEGGSLDAAPEPGADAAALDTLIADERSRRTWKAVAALPSGERTAVILYYRDEMAVRDIAQALGVRRTDGRVCPLRRWPLRAAQAALRGERLTRFSWPAGSGRSGAAPGSRRARAPPPRT